MNWVKIERINDVLPQRIYLPSQMIREMPGQGTLRFGQREVKVLVQESSEVENASENTHNSFLIIKLPQSVIKDLLLQESLVYQINILDGVINIGPVVGLLLGEQHYYYQSKYMKEYTDALNIYEKVGGLYYAFKPGSIDWEHQCVYGLYFHYESNTWNFGKFPLPSVVFRRGYRIRGDEIEKLKQITGGKVYNSLRLDKWETYKKLSGNKTLREYLPETMQLDNINTLNKFMKNYDQVILKPVGLSRGRGICIITKKERNKLIIHDYRGARKKSYLISDNELIKFIQKAKFIERNYIIQAYINLARINGALFDIRVVMQKNVRNNWTCSGIECRVAGPEELITNISRGGQALPILQTVKLAFGPTCNPYTLKNDIIAIAKKFCESMEEAGECFAEFGVDIAIDKDGKIWFIEANVRPTFKGFKKMNYQEYLHICHTPILYASFLAGFSDKSNWDDHKKK